MTLDLDAYLERIGYGGATAPTPATLAALHEAHVRAVPFENLDVALGRTIALDVPSLERKIVAGRRGGYCFEQNSLFRAVLEALGFEAVLLEGRVRRTADASAARTHALLLVTTTEGPFVADVGFGAGGLVRPLPLTDGAVDREEGHANALFRPGKPLGGVPPAPTRGDRWVLAQETPEGFTPRYDFSLEPPLPIDLEVANHYTATHPASSFVKTLTAQKRVGRTWIVLRDRELTRTSADGVSTRTLSGPEELLDVLRDSFGLAFPPGTRFRVPRFDDAG